MYYESCFPELMSLKLTKRPEGRRYGVLIQIMFEMTTNWSVLSLYMHLNLPPHLGVKLGTGTFNAGG